MEVAKYIAKEDLKSFKEIQFEGEIKTISTDEGLTKALDYLNKQQVVGFDTETRPSFKKGVLHKIALMQLGTKEVVYLIHLHKVGFSEGLRQFLMNPDILKLGIAIHDDFLSLKRSFKVVKPQGFIDLNTKAQQIGFESIGVKKLSALLLGKTVSKRAQLSNWEKFPLDPEQKVYAATDAWICIELFEKMKMLPEYE